jgi:hypothetical protein
VKQLTIFCNRDEEERVVTALDHAGIASYLRIGEATGNRFLDPGQIPRAMTWEATMFVVPAVSEDRMSAAVKELRAHARDCEIEPCLRIVVSPVDDVY